MPKAQHPVVCFEFRLEKNVLLRRLVHRHVLVVLLQLLSVLGDLNGFGIEDANRYMLATKFNRTIRRRDPSFEQPFPPRRPLPLRKFV